MNLQKRDHAPLSTREVVELVTLGRAPERNLREKYQKTEHWKEMTREVTGLYRTCVLCGKDRRLVVHHRHYRTLFSEDPHTDVTLLCSRCHGKHHRGMR